MTINVTKYRLNPDRIFGGTRGSYGMEKLSFDFGDGWDFDTISVTFHPQRGKPIKVPILPGTEIDIPAEVIEHSGESRFVVSGRAVGEDGTIERQAITLEGYVDVAYTADEKGGNTRKVTPDMYDHLIDQASKIFDEAREDVERTAAEAAGFASGAEGFANSAEEDADSAEKSASAAKTAEQAASKSAGEAKTAADTATGAASNAAQSADDATSAASAAKASATTAENSRKSVEQIAEGIPKTVQNALQEAKGSGEFDGEDGITPHIGENENWYIGNKDTGVRAKGKSGVHVGGDTPPEGTKVWVNPNGERTKIPKVDETLAKPGYAADAAKVGEKINQLSDEIGDLDNRVTESYVLYVSGGSFINKADGKIYAGANYGSTAFIPVNGGESIKIKGFHCPNGTNASVCAYDFKFAFVGAIVINESDAGDGRIVALDNNVAYIRVTSTNTGCVVVDYIDKPVATRTTEEPPYNLGTLTSNCYVNKSNGEILSNTSYYGVTDFVEVTARYLKIENPNLSANGGICEYDANKNFISCLLFPEIKGGQYVVKLSENAKYVRATIVNNNANWLRLYPVSTVDEDSETSDVLDSWLVATGNQIKTPHRKINALSPTITFIDDDTMRYDAVKRYHDIFAKFGKSKNLYNKSAITDGYTIHSQSGANYATDGYSVSDYIPVDGNAQYTFSRKGTIAPYWLLTKIAFYDIEKNFISIAPTQDSPFITPADTAYLRFSTSTARMEGDETDGYIQLEKGSTATAYEEYSEGSHRIKGCYGVITDYIDNDESLKNLLLSYEDEGFGMLFHAKWQDAYYMDDENRDIVLAEADYCQGMRKMQNIGFIDYNYWVSPYGVTDDEITSMCKRHGAKCLLSTSNNTFIQSNGLDGNAQSVKRYALPRCSLGYNDSQYPAFTLADLKAQIDKCVQSGGWLIVTTHVQQWSDEYGTTPDDRLREIIQYALDKGCKIKTFAEAYAERNSILMINDVC